MFRWDGERFLGLADELTLPRNTAGGQVLPSQQPLGALHISAPIDTSDAEASASGDGRMHRVLIGSGTRARVFRGLRERVQGLKTPVDLKITHDGQFVYTAAQGSRSIVAFRRNSTSGLLTYSPEASYNTDWTQDQARGEYVANPQLVGEGGGIPLRGVAALEISTDGSEVFVASILDNCVVAFDRDEVSGALRVRKVIKDGDVLGGRVVDGLAGARSLALSANNQRLFVSGWLDQAVAVFGRSESNDLSYRGRVRTVTIVACCEH